MRSAVGHWDGVQRQHPLGELDPCLRLRAQDRGDDRVGAYFDKRASQFEAMWRGAPHDCADRFCYAPDAIRRRCYDPDAEQGVRHLDILLR
jgi:hypothetical protein